MARCFPYLPPDYKRVEYAKEEPLVESIKFQKEWENAKERKEEKKRQKKDMRDKSIEHHGTSKHIEHNHKKRKCYERGQLNEKDECCTKTTKDVIEQLEKSGLTEENGLPCSIVNPYDSSDSTQDSSKRRKLAATDVGHSNRGLILRIKLPIQKHKDGERPATSEQPSFSGRVVETQPSEICRNPPLQKHRELLPPATNEQPCFSGRVVAALPLLQKHKAPEQPTTNEQPCFSGRVAKAATTETAGGQFHLERRSSRAKEMERQFKELIVNWNPPPLLFGDPDIGDKEWLFGTKQQRNNPSAKTCGANSAEVLDLDHGSGTSSLQPRYLPEFDLYQLPYVIPF